MYQYYRTEECCTSFTYFIKCNHNSGIFDRDSKSLFNIPTDDKILHNSLISHYTAISTVKSAKNHNKLVFN